MALAVLTRVKPIVKCKAVLVSQTPLPATHIQINDAEDFSMEDVTFCLKCKDKGIPVFAHPKVIVGHNKVMELKA